MIWLLLVIVSILMWSSTCLLYKAGVHEEKEEHICLKFSVCIGIVFFAIALVYLIIREEEFSIFESAVKYWPMTLFGIVYVIVNTIYLKDMSTTKQRWSRLLRESAAVCLRYCSSSPISLLAE